MERQGPDRRIALQYVKTGKMVNGQWPSWEDDPIRFADSASQGLVWISTRCQIRRWDMTILPDGPDASGAATIIVDQDNLTDDQFDCLASFVKPQFVTLTRMTQ